VISFLSVRELNRVNRNGSTGSDIILISESVRHKQSGQETEVPEVISFLSVRV
jgi:hypothetical protein